MSKPVKVGYDYVTPENARVIADIASQVNIEDRFTTGQWKEDLISY